MLLLILGLAVFLGGHSISIFAPQRRDRMVLTQGLGRWRLGYSLASLLGGVSPIA